MNARATQLRFGAPRVVGQGQPMHRIGRKRCRPGGREVELAACADLRERNLGTSGCQSWVWHRSTWEEAREGRGSALAESAGKYPNVFEKMNEMTDLVRHADTHAVGILIANQPLPWDWPLSGGLELSSSTRPRSKIPRAVDVATTHSQARKRWLYRAHRSGYIPSSGICVFRRLIKNMAATGRVVTYYHVRQGKPRSRSITSTRSTTSTRR